MSRLTTKQRRSGLRRRASVELDRWYALGDPVAGHGLMYWPERPQRLAMAAGRWPYFRGGYAFLLGNQWPAARQRKERRR